MRYNSWIFNDVAAGVQLSAAKSTDRAREKTFRFQKNIYLPKWVYRKIINRTPILPLNLTRILLEKEVYLISKLFCHAYTM